ncbi:hypothetical protein DY000_02043896 [Brassica cretica]|uniref:F-box domain-containing protein n=1 Tax=Brassica cretica TaxID=69181 RepID=A0ABQ7BMS3_BRACR|nr:hypothetical protein DY000_02043896 [Brassica cretica]
MMKRVKRSKKRDERIVNDPFKKLPNDLNVEILMKMPPRSIARLRFASKHLSSIILDKEFTKLYMTRSSTQPRHLISVHRGGSSMQMQRFHSLSQDHPSFSNHEKVSYKLDPNLPYEFTPPVRGLICGRNGTKMMVGNPSTGQFLTLPKVKTTRRGIISFFGYDPVNDVYKVLCMTILQGRQRRGSKVVSEEHQRPDLTILIGSWVCAHLLWSVGEAEVGRLLAESSVLKLDLVQDLVGSGSVPPTSLVLSQNFPIQICRSEMQRRVEALVGDFFPVRFSHQQSMAALLCRSGFKIQHRTTRTPLLVSYLRYIASLISFDLISEEFNAIKLPEDIPCVVNYTGKVAITSWPTRNGEVHLWILEDANKQEWSKVSIVVPSWIDLIDIHHGYRFRGTLSTGELIFSPWTLPINPLYFISYNLKENIAKKVVVEELEEPYASREVYFDHVESPMFCQIMLHEDVRLVKEFCHYSGMIALTSQSDNN